MSDIAPRQLWWLGAGFIVWSSALVALYALHAVGCAFDWSSGSLRAGLGLVLLAHLALLGWTWWRVSLLAPRGGFVHVVALWSLWAALASILIMFVPTLLLSTCL